MTAKEECEKLMNDLVDFAEKMLLEHGEFYPFGGYMCDDGSMVDVGAEMEGTDHPSSVDLFRVLKENMGALAAKGGCKCLGIVFDVRIRPPGEAEKMDAIQVNLDHRDDYSKQVFFPYRLVNGKIEYAPVFAQKGDREMFVNSQRD